MKIDVWRAFFNDYRNLKVGLLYAKGEGPDGYTNMASDFEVVNKMHLDMLNEKVNTLFDSIKHGDEKHQTWLKEAIERHFNTTGPQPVAQGDEK